MKKSTLSSSQSASSVAPPAMEEQEMMNEFRDVLDLLQREGASVSKEKLSGSLQSLGYNPTEDELQEMIEGVVASEADTVDISYFLELMAKQMKDEDSASRLREAFGKFDKDQNGFISATELRNALINMGENLTDKDVDRMIRLADIDGDGQVDFQEFVNMMMSRT